MSTQEKPPISNPVLDENQVVEYLKVQRDFFNKHVELLTELSIPHMGGGVVSLIERQVETLREQNTRLRTQFKELVDVARDNEVLSHQLHELTLRLMSTVTPASIFTNLQQSLEEDFKADAVSVLVFADGLMKDGMKEFIGRASNAEKLFEEFLIKGYPLCGQLSEQQQHVLFHDVTDEIASVVLLPLQYHDWTGVMAVGSRDASRYRPGMGIDLLAHLSDVMSLVLDPWVIKMPEREPPDSGSEV